MVHLDLFSLPFYLATGQYHPTGSFLIGIGRDGGLSTLCQSCRFACHQRVLEDFLALVISVPEWNCLTMAFFDKCGYTWFAILSCYGSIAVSYGKDGCLSTFYHSCRFACQQKLLKTFPGSAGYLHSEDGIV